MIQKHLIGSVLIQRIVQSVISLLRRMVAVIICRALVVIISVGYAVVTLIIKHTIIPVVVTRMRMVRNLQERVLRDICIITTIGRHILIPENWKLKQEML